MSVDDSTNDADITILENGEDDIVVNDSTLAAELSKKGDGSIWMVENGSLVEVDTVNSSGEYSSSK